MALGGGTFVTQNKPLVGTYINFISTNNASATLSDRGIATMPVSLDWGADDTVFKVESSDFYKNALTIFGYNYTDNKLTGIRDLFKNCTTLYAYRLNSGEKASNEFATAKYSGIRGNDIKITVSQNVDYDGKYDVSTLLEAAVYDTQTVSNASELVSNDWVDFKSNAELIEVLAKPLVGGKNGTITGLSHQNYLNKIEKYAYNVMGVVTTDNTIKSLYASFCKRMRDEIGSKFQLVLFDYSADYEAVVNVKNKAIVEGEIEETQTEDIPTEPEVPAEPEIEVPTEPEIEVPVEPEVPTEPEIEVPAEPEIPTEPEVETPVEPEPEVPTEPAEPETPVEPEIETPTEPEEVIPEDEEIIVPDLPVTESVKTLSIINETETYSNSTASLVYWVTGIIGGCAINKSNTNKLYDGEFDIDVDYTQSELAESIVNGEFILHQVGDDIRVLEDINSLVTETSDKNNIFKDNQTVRVIDQIATDIAVTFATKYLGVIPNDKNGRIALKTDIIKHHKQLEIMGAIEDFDVDDITVDQGNTKKEVVVTDAITVVNSMNKLYMTVSVS